MKGLLIKDFQLLKAQKSFFMVLIAVAVGMCLFSYDTSFITGFLTFAVSLFTISTVSYDEFDNGNAFLFSLPISRTGYVMDDSGRRFLSFIHVYGSDSRFLKRERFVSGYSDDFTGCSAFHADHSGGYAAVSA